MEASLDWQWRNDGPDLSQFHLADVAATPDGGFVIVGSGFETQAADRRVAYALRTDAEGRVAWQAAYPVRGVDVRLEAVHPVSRGRYLLAGSVASNSDRVASGWLGVLDESAPRRLTPEPTTTRTTTTRTTRTTTSTRTTTPATTDGTTDVTATTDQPTTTTGQPGFGVAAGVAGALGGLLAYARTRGNRE